MAMAQRRQRGLFDPDAKPGTSPFDHHVYVIASDGDMQEGVSHEACALAGHQELGNLTVVYDANQISIEDDTDIAFSEDVGARFEAYGWHVVEVDWRQDADGASYVEDVDALLAAIRSGDKVTDKPTLVVLHTIIAWPAPTKQNTGKSHGSALGDDEVGATKELLGFDPKKSFTVEPSVLKHARDVVKRGKAAHREWDKSFKAWRKANPDRAQLLDRILSGEAPAGLTKACRPSPPTRRGSPPAPRRARSSPPSPTSCRSSGAARPTSPSPTTRRWRASPPSSPAASRRARGRAAPTGAPCTSASGRTAWG